MAREQARHAQSLEELETILAGFDGCALKFSAKNLAFADGNPEGRVMLVGEAPGADEDREGRPFVGASGQVLRQILTAAGTYAAIRADLREAIVTAKTAEARADQAHTRIDRLQDRRP